MTLFGSWPGFLTRRHFMSTQLCGAQGRGLFGFCFGLLLLFHLQWWTKFFWDFTNEYDELWTLMDYAGLWWIMMDYEMYKPIQRCDLHKVLKGFECACPSASTYPWTFPSCSPFRTMGWFRGKIAGKASFFFSAINFCCSKILFFCSCCASVPLAELETEKKIAHRPRSLWSLQVNCAW